MSIIEQIEKSEMERLVAERPVPEFAPGDTVRVHFKVVEGTRERVQVYEGVVIARSSRGLNSSFTVRKISYGEGVERVFPLYSPRIEKIEVVRRGAVRRAKLYYLRSRRGSRVKNCDSDARVTPSSSTIRSHIFKVYSRTSSLLSRFLISLQYSIALSDDPIF